MIFFIYLGHYYSYKMKPNQHGCCLNNGNRHRKCICRDVKHSQCLVKCDKDFGCKGFYDVNGHCQLVTHSNCITHMDSTCPNPVESRERETGIGSCGRVDQQTGTCFIKSNSKSKQVM